MVAKAKVARTASSGALSNMAAHAALVPLYRLGLAKVHKAAGPLLLLLARVKRIITGPWQTLWYLAWTPRPARIPPG